MMGMCHFRVVLQSWPPLTSPSRCLAGYFYLTDICGLRPIANVLNTPVCCSGLWWCHLALDTVPAQRAEHGGSPLSPFHPSDFGEVSFLSMPVGTIVGPSEAKPASITSRTPLIFQPYPKKSGVTPESPAHMVSWFGLYKGWLPKSF